MGAHKIKFRVASASAGLLACASSFADITMVVGHVYTADHSSNTIIQTTAAGQLVGSQSFPGYVNGLKGIGFGPDGNLYVVAIKPGGYDVLRIGGEGQIRGTYLGTGNVTGNLSLGKIAISSSRRLYVADARGLVTFDYLVPEDTVIYQANQVYDVKILPAGNVFALSAYKIDEITSQGALVRTIDTSISLADARGIEYDSATNKLFVTMLGYSGYSFQVMRFDATSGTLEHNQSFGYGDDMAFLANGRLLVGSRTQAPGVFTTEIGFIGPLNTTQRMFVAVMPETTVLFEDGMEGY